ncbi:MAG: phosphoribosyl-AMP cyclohydrolase [Candidatus Margulisiibacteriota bacterium]|jgi:phosphoribosyl-AMP cyclohydrolase/phosphoribosyl-ATP pyrophosphohydrolase/phosphoribosyl-AMP cyclohydrolase
MDISKIKFDDKGLVPVIAQDYKDGTVLMLAYMSKESLEITLKTKEMVYWSRSRKVLWHKGETSGHIQKVKELCFDCDGDAIVAKIEQVGDIACHTGNRSCFFNKLI